MGNRVALVETPNETSKNCNTVLGLDHSMEAWGDAEAYRGHYSLQQPTITRLFNTRSLTDCLLKWTGDNRDGYTYLRDFWKESVLADGDFNTQ